MVFLPQIFGPVGFFSGFFLNPANILVTLAFLVPLILLYLIRPKPINVAVPSLMFILNDMGKGNVHRFFRTILRDVLFLLQALAIILLGLALAKPFINVNQESLVKQSIVIIDASASTRAFDDARFGEIQSAAQDSLAGDNIIIVARTNPYVIMDHDDPHLSAGAASDFIDDLKPSDEEGDLPSALDLATQYVGPDSKVTVVSDFVLSSLESPDLVKAKIKVLRSKGALVETKTIESQGDNVGIIDAALNSQNATLDIKIQNFNPKPAEIGLEYNGENIVLPKNLLEPEGKPGSLLTVSIPVAHGKSEIKLTPNDDFDVDNHYFVSLPDRETTKVLIISNDGSLKDTDGSGKPKHKLIAALNSAGDQFNKIQIEQGVPPKVPDLNHEVYIIKDVNPEFILPGVIKDLHDRVENGAVLVVFAQPGLFSINMETLLPVSLKPDAEPLTGKQELLINATSSLMKGLSDGQVNGDQLQRVSRTEDAIVHAYVMTNDGPEPVVAHKRIGKGAVIYYGIKDAPTIDITPNEYAILWGRIIDYSIPDIRLLNAATGAVITSPTKQIVTPLGKQASPVIATRSGIYLAGQNAIATNLYPLHTSSAGSVANIQYESVISKSANITAEDAAGVAGSGEEAKVPRDLSFYALIAGMIAMLLELLYIKFRGDL